MPDISSEVSIPHRTTEPIFLEHSVQGNCLKSWGLKSGTGLFRQRVLNANELKVGEFIGLHRPNDTGRFNLPDDSSAGVFGGFTPEGNIVIVTDRVPEHGPIRQIDPRDNRVLIYVLTVEYDKLITMEKERLAREKRINQILTKYKKQKSWNKIPPVYEE